MQFCKLTSEQQEALILALTTELKSLIKTGLNPSEACYELAINTPETIRSIDNIKIRLLIISGYINQSNKKYEFDSYLPSVGSINKVYSAFKRAELLKFHYSEKYFIMEQLAKAITKPVIAHHKGDADKICRSLNVSAYAPKLRKISK